MWPSERESERATKLARKNVVVPAGAKQNNKRSRAQNNIRRNLCDLTWLGGASQTVVLLGNHFYGKIVITIHINKSV